MSTSTIIPHNSQFCFTLNDSRRDGSIITPEDKPIMPYGTVVAIDPASEPAKRGIVPGSRVLINPNAAMLIPTEDGELFFAHTSSIFGVYFTPAPVSSSVAEKTSIIHNEN